MCCYCWWGCNVTRRCGVARSRWAAGCSLAGYGMWTVRSKSWELISVCRCEHEQSMYERELEGFKFTSSHMGLRSMAPRVRLGCTDVDHVVLRHRRCPVRNAGRSKGKACRSERGRSSASCSRQVGCRFCVNRDDIALRRGLSGHRSCTLLCVGPAGTHMLHCIYTHLGSGAVFQGEFLGRCKTCWTQFVAHTAWGLIGGIHASTGLELSLPQGLLLHLLSSRASCTRARVDSPPFLQLSLQLCCPSTSTCFGGAHQLSCCMPAVDYAGVKALAM